MTDPKEPWILKQIKDAIKTNKEGPGHTSEICSELIEWDHKAARDVAELWGADVFLVADDCSDERVMDI